MRPMLIRLLGAEHLTRHNQGMRSKFSIRLEKYNPDAHGDATVMGNTLVTECIVVIEDLSGDYPRIVYRESASKLCVGDVNNGIQIETGTVTVAQVKR